MPGPDPATSALDILRVFVVSTDPAFVSAEIAEQFDITVEGARHRLDKLVERGLLAKKKPGERTVVYWATEKGKKYYEQHADDLG